MVTNLFAIVLISLALLEPSLRIQQRLGPFYDLEMRDLDLNVLSDDLNHVPPVGSVPRYVKGEWRTRTANADGIVTSSHRPANPKGVLSILFLGDSFMEGYDEEYSVPGQVLRQFVAHGFSKTELTFLNAGHSSYAPSIFIPQLKKLIPKYHPDMVVIDIDETDLGDDFFRYRPLVSRDGRGRITAVRRSFLNDAFLQGLHRAREHPLYLQRFAQKLIHTKIKMPLLEKRLAYYDQELILRLPSLNESEVYRQYPRALPYFLANLNELCQTLTELRVRKAIFLHHPHKQHLEEKWNSLVANAVRESAHAHGFHFFAADEILKKEPHFDALYFINDMHFNFEGIARYGQIVATHLQQLINPPPALIADLAHLDPHQ